MAATLCRYMPPIKEDLIDPEVVSFHPNNARKSVFTGKLFLFLEKKQVGWCPSVHIYWYAISSEVCLSWLRNMFSLPQAISYRLRRHAFVRAT